ncbi:acyltransferase family protein [Streptomyces litchfieldiae]|uniref:Acyltransferase n=1 Tax=Streptomyces litchfieldiae TaxID=3075543 RepID=A0ABU2MIG0_9ACTN|nr:acyltransferase [Streptomyces sp. DSM 44938]MDT0341305.1 acyltransferase [Streptomyces sp. DSM 44938]
MTRLPSLTGLRFPCAMAVFLAHAWWVPELFASETARSAVLPVLPFAMTGVSCFFVISGFVLTWSAREDDTPRAFWRRRAAKIYPSHVLVWVALLIFLLALGADPIGEDREGSLPWLAVLTNLFLVHSWSPDWRFTAGVNIVTWSLTVEVFAYALLPLLLRVLRRVRPERLWAVAGVTVAVIWAVPLAVLPLGGENVPEVDVPRWHFWLPYMFPLARLPEFVLGAVLALLLRSGRRAPVGMTGAAGLIFVSLSAGAALLPFPFLPVAVTAVPVGLLVMAAAAADVSGGRSWLRRPVPEFLGRISFTFYLVHWPVILVLDRLWGRREWPVPQALGMTVLFAAGSLVAAWLLHRTVEVPLTRRLAARPRPLPGAPHDDDRHRASPAPDPARGVHPPRTAQVPLPEPDGGRARRDGGPARRT